MPISARTRIGLYEILSPLGAGGMGEVYLARDTRLERKVALKLLPQEFTQHSDRLRRFEQEAKAASATNHPNILTIYEFGVASTEAGDTHFIATEYVEGPTLRQQMGREKLSLAAALDVAVQIASALAAAHEAGIIHRDIKPENVMLRRDGIVKVLDFGLAKLTEQQPPAFDPEAPTRAKVNTDPGTVMGTANYMSPEQARGQKVDARTDIFSLGVVLYEMLAGRAPFVGGNVLEVVSEILKTEAAPLKESLPDTPRELEHIVAKALRKDREARYQTVKDLLIDLKDLKQELEYEARQARSRTARVEDATTNAAPLAPQTAAAEAAHTTSSAEYLVSEIKRHKLAALVALLVLVAVATGIGLYLQAQKTGAIDSLAVLPFANVTADPNTEYLADGVTDSLIYGLSQLPSLKVKSHSSVFRYKGKDIDPQTVGKDLGVQAVLTGRITQRGDGLLINTELVEVGSSNVLWGQQYNRRLADAQAVQGEIAQEVSAKLRLKLAGEGAPGAKNKTVSPEAYQAYLKGRYYYYKNTEESLKTAIQLFNRAISLEPNYAQAFAGLALAYSFISSEYLPPSEAMPKAKQAVLKALAFDGSLAAAHLALAQIHWWGDWDFPAAEQEFKRAIELNQNEPEAYSAYAVFLASVLGRFDEAMIMANRALQLDSLSLVFHGRVVFIFLSAHQYDRMAEEANKILELDHNSALGHNWLGLAYLLKGQYEQAIAELQKAVDPQSGDFLEVLGYAYAVAGRKREALKTLTELQALAERRYLAPSSIAQVYVGLGEKEHAFQWLEKAYAGRDDGLTQLKTDPRFDDLHSDPRFTALVRRVGLTP